MSLLYPTLWIRKLTVSAPRKSARGLLSNVGDPWARDREWGAGTSEASRGHRDSAHASWLGTPRGGESGAANPTAFTRPRRTPTPSGPPSPPAPAAPRASFSRACPDEEGGRTEDPRAGRSPSVPFPPPPSGGSRGGGCSSRLEGALAPRSRAQQVPWLPPPPRGERGRAGARGGEGEQEEERGRLAERESAAGGAG